MMVAFINAHRAEYGVEPICAVLPIAPSTCYRDRALQANPARRSARAQRDDALRAAIERVYDANHRVYGARKGWRQLVREGVRVARCTVERLMRAMGPTGVVARPAHAHDDPGGRSPASAGLGGAQLHRDAADQLWVSDLTYVATWRGFVYVAFVIDVFARRIVGWCVSSGSGGSTIIAYRNR